MLDDEEDSNDRIQDISEEMLCDIDEQLSCHMIENDQEMLSILSLLISGIDYRLQNLKNLMRKGVING